MTEIDMMLLQVAQAFNMFVSVTLTGDVDVWEPVKVRNDWC